VVLALGRARLEFRFALGQPVQSVHGVQQCWTCLGVGTYERDHLISFRKHVAALIRSLDLSIATGHGLRNAGGRSRPFLMFPYHLSAVRANTLCRPFYAHILDWWRERVSNPDHVEILTNPPNPELQPAVGG